MTTDDGIGRDFARLLRRMGDRDEMGRALSGLAVGSMNAARLAELRRRYPSASSDAEAIERERHRVAAIVKRRQRERRQPSSDRDQS